MPRGLVFMWAATVLAGCATHVPVERPWAPAPPPVEARSRPPAVIDHATARKRPVDPGPIHLVLKLGERRVYVVEVDPGGGPPRWLESFPVAIGRKEYQTPIGRFAVTDMVEDPIWVQFDWNDPSHEIREVPPGPDNPLGARWIGFGSAHGWGVGFHGTPKPELIGQAVSHGCVRMRNRDVIALYQRVRIGTKVIVEP